ncbi:hypothetical protein D8B26_002363 [Coccidioides posadasii str. Silveira]|uniref:Uncharacterized protein n=1 Tax=Coccidioides posadasii (strain RMSCC 757 / Silveira) TaxID=443226 RepID=E9DD00_COCPS|nr:conserved hypothetical protein [Coccidioides posadasii str. Silveira]QVM07670.1 hypothetical protein D8B26_002363 [Coccidioides posadasii str. Silveira]
MAEQSSHDVVNQTRSGGDLSPSDVPASKPDKFTTGGDGVDVQTLDSKHQRRQDITTASQDKPDGKSITTQDDLATSTKKLEANGIESPIGDYGTSLNHLGDGSGGSDTDASRSDIRSSSKDSTQHSRTSSVKRPASFKPVSFAKFSISKSPNMAAASKYTAEQAPFSASNTSSAPAQQTSRPRLVAKSTSSMRDSTPRALAGSGRSGSGAPDPNQVWNKNRPVQPPPTKHLTDEELKQQYGIHMTSRIQADGDGKEAKWADIDDDEDDWAPETIEWNDGTKINLTQTETNPTPTQTKGETQDTTQQTTLSDKKLIGRGDVKVLASKPPNSLGPNATILKLGANADKQQARSGSDSTKGTNDKDSAIPKGLVPPAKSPWAPLPPIDKVPVTVNPPTQPHRHSRFFHGERSGVEPTSPLPVAAKEIAADDFNRSWRDTQSAAPRELYNSQSGRYEPVSEMRRGQYKNEAHFRPSSLLQRPNHNEQSGPAEPSPAFQTNRSSTSQENTSWSRRRASSNVSGGSGVMGRRLSMSKPDLSHKPHDLPQPRRGSQQNERSTSPRRQYQKGSYIARGASPSRPPVQGMPNHASSSHYTPPASHGGIVHPLATDSPLSQMPPMEDPIAMQQRIMREKREMARQRRLEEEAKEEAAKQERIRLKLEAMGPPPSEKKDSTSALESAKQTTVAPSPPKPPLPEPSGEPKQYGMMKVHPPEPVKKLVPSGERPDVKTGITGPQSHQISSRRESKFEAARTSMPPSINGVHSSTEMSAVQMPESQQDASGDRNLTWKGPMPTTSSYSSWSGTKIGAHPSVGSLWGPPNNDKALGNGTFDKNLAGFPSRDISSHGPLMLSDQPPIGPPQHSAERINASERTNQHLHGVPKSIADNGSSLSPLPSPEQRPGRLAGADSLKPISRPGPIAPPNTYSQGQRWQQNQFPRRSEETAPWNNFHLAARKAELEENERFHRELQARREEEARSGIKPALQVTFDETWRQVKTDEAGQRNVVSVNKTTEKSAPLSPLPGLEPIDGLPFSDPNAKVGTTARGSRFFPHGSDQTKRPSDRDNVEPRSPSPPPPEEVSSHPAFTTDSPRPLVHLPAPKPRVRLPPRSSPPPAAPPATFASMVASGPPPPRGSQPIASTATWQDRFNGLFGKKTSQPPHVRRTVLAVASATKEPLEVLPDTLSASVSLPQFDDVESTRDAGKVASKEVEDEEAIFEDREAGSLPVVKVPHMAPKAAWQPALPPSHQRLRSRFQRPVQVQSIEPYIFSSPDRNNPGGVTIIIHLPGTEILKTLTMPGKAGVSSGNNQTRHRSHNFKHRRGAKSREGSGPSSGPYHTSQPPKKMSSPTSGPSRSHSGHGNWASRVAGTAV